MSIPFDELVIASHNTGKVLEIGKMLRPMGLRVFSAKELDLPEPEETGVTFTENALLKSRSAYEHSKLPSLADDSGLVVPLLDGAPGIYSARWAGETKDFNVAMQRLQKECEAKGESSPEAYFICVLALSRPQKADAFFEGRIDGMLKFPPQGEKGFGYDPVFVPNGYDVTFAEIDGEEKQRISHRARAFEGFIEWLSHQKAA